jgi:hypothetical protein
LKGNSTSYSFTHLLINSSTNPYGGEKIGNKVLKIFAWLSNLAIKALLLYRRLWYGYAFRRIPMAGPKYAIVDPEDYERLRKYEWFSRKGRNSYYANRHGIRKKNGNKSLIQMHRMIIEVPEGKVVDHKNRNGMDNRKANLRPATHSQNMCNKRKHPGKKNSKYRGVYWKKSHRKWAALIGFQRKKINLGYFNNEIDAAKAYDEAAKKYHGEFACLNFPEPSK